MIKCLLHGSFIWPPNLTVRNLNISRLKWKNAGQGKDKLAWFPVILLEYFSPNEVLKLLLLVLVTMQLVWLCYSQWSVSGLYLNWLDICCVQNPEVHSLCTLVSCSWNPPQCNWFSMLSYRTRLLSHFELQYYNRPRFVATLIVISRWIYM